MLVLKLEAAQHSILGLGLMHPFGVVFAKMIAFGLYTHSPYSNQQLSCNLNEALQVLEDVSEMKATEAVYIR